MTFPKNSQNSTSSDSVRQAARSYVAQLRQARLDRLNGAAGRTVPTKTPDKARPTRRQGVVGKRGVRAAAIDTQTGGATCESVALQADALADLQALSGKPAKSALPKKAVAKRKPKKQAPPSDEPATQKAASGMGQSAPSAKRVFAPVEGLQTRAQSADEGPKEPQRLARQAARQAVRDAAAQARAAAHDAQQKIREARLAQRAAAAKQGRGPAVPSGRKDRAVKAASSSSSFAAPPSAGRRRWTPQRTLSQTVAQPEAMLQQGSKRNERQGALAPLTSVRGIGDAMSRRLKSAGIHDLEDLVAEGPATIRERLGPVSALANVERWQEEAAQFLS